jgi:hypothetical protein
MQIKLCKQNIAGKTREAKFRVFEGRSGSTFIDNLSYKYSKLAKI